MRTIFALLFPLTLLAPLARADDRVKLELVETVDVPGFSIEIVQYHAPLKLLLATNPHWKTIDVFDVESLDPPVLHARDFNDEQPDAQGLFTVYEPTSVALHPTQPVALVAVIGRKNTETGRLIAFDLREESFGAWVLNQPVGFHPDCVAVSHDGRWAIMACEGEGDPDSPGSIWAVDLTTLTADHRAKDGPLPAVEVGNLGKLLRQPAGDIEPEYVAIDPQSRFAVVSCQENNTIVYVDLQQPSGPALAGFSALNPGGEPDGVSILDDVPHPDDPARVGCLVAVAEEGRFDKFGNQTGQFLTLLWVAPQNLGESALVLSSTHIPTALGDKDPNKRRDPENLVAFRRGGRDIVVLAVERGDLLLAFDVTDPRKPVLCDKVKVGDRPEGVILVDNNGELLILTGDEGDGNQGPGTISFTRLQFSDPHAAR